ncbi:hypothetical protein ACWGDX_05345 [Streptomyces sp. NPDC055025]
MLGGEQGLHRVLSPALGVRPQQHELGVVGARLVRDPAGQMVLKDSVAGAGDDTAHVRGRLVGRLDDDLERVEEDLGGGRPRPLKKITPNSAPGGRRWSTSTTRPSARGIVENAAIRRRVPRYRVCAPAAQLPTHSAATPMANFRSIGIVPTVGTPIFSPRASCVRCLG